MTSKEAREGQRVQLHDKFGSKLNVGTVIQIDSTSNGSVHIAWDLRDGKQTQPFKYPKRHAQFFERLKPVL